MILIRYTLQGRSLILVFLSHILYALCVKCNSVTLCHFMSLLCRFDFVYSSMNDCPLIFKSVNCEALDTYSRYL